MNILLVVLVPLLGVIVYEALSNFYVNLHRDETVVEKIPCSLHDWVLNGAEQMICMVCNKRAGE